MSVWKDHKRGVWITKFSFQNRQHKREGFETRAAALTWEVEKRDELKHPPEPEQIRLAFSQVSTMYLEDCKARFQENTWRQKSYVFRSFITYLQHDPAAELITKQMFAEHLKSRKDKDGNCAANRDLKEFKSLYNWCIRQELLLKNPCINIENYPEKPFIKYVPPEKDIKKVLVAADADDMDLVMVLYHTAGRISEVLNMTWDDVNFEHKWIRLWTRKRRGGELQEDKLAMTDTVYDVLNRRWNNRNNESQYVFCNADGTPLTYYQKRYTMRNLCKKAKVKTFGFHAIRHHVASILGDSGKASIGQIQKLLRHRRSTTTDNYIKSLDPQMRQVANVLDEHGKLEENLQSGTKTGTIS